MVAENKVISTVPIEVMAKSVAASRYFRDVQTADQALVILALAEELDVNRFDALRGLRLIDGQLSMMAALVTSKIKRSGVYDYRIKSSTNEGCVLEFTQKGEAVGESSFSVEDAKRAGLVKDKSGWQKYPADMCFARALTRGARRFCPDLFGGSVYTPEELGGEHDWSKLGPGEEEPNSRPSPAGPRMAQPAAAAEELKQDLAAAHERTGTAPADAPAPEQPPKPAEARAQTPDEWAAEFVQRYRAKGYGDAKIQIIAKMQPKGLQAALSKLLEPAETQPPADAELPPAEAGQDQAQDQESRTDAPAEPPADPPHIMRLKRTIERYGLTRQNQARWLVYFKVKKIEDLTEAAVEKIINKADTMYAKEETAGATA